MSPAAAQLLATLTANAWLTKQDLMDRYGVSEKTIRRWGAAGALPRPYYPGKQRSPRWRLSEVLVSEQKTFRK